MKFKFYNLQIDIINKFWVIFNYNKTIYHDIPKHCSLKKKYEIINYLFYLLFDEIIEIKTDFFSHRPGYKWEKKYRVIIFYDIYKYKIISFIIYYFTDKHFLYEKYIKNFNIDSINYLDTFSNKFVFLNKKKQNLLNLHIKNIIKKINLNQIYYIIYICNILKIPTVLIKYFILPYTGLQ